MSRNYMLKMLCESGLSRAVSFAALIGRRFRIDNVFVLPGARRLLLRHYAKG
jgi:hypothetical protein